MIDKLKQYEVAWAGFVEWLYTKHGDYPFIYEIGWGIKRKNEFISDRELSSLLIEWLDSKRIYVEIQHYPSITKKAKIYWHWEIKGELSPIGFVSRPKATEAGIIKGFEIYNQKEK